MSSRCVIGTDATRSAVEAATFHCSRRKQDVLMPAPHRTVSTGKRRRFSRHAQGTMVYSLMPVLLRKKRNRVSILMTRAVADMFEFAKVGSNVISVRPFPAMCSWHHTGTRADRVCGERVFFFACREMCSDREVFDERAVCGCFCTTVREHTQHVLKTRMSMIVKGIRSS